MDEHQVDVGGNVQLAPAELAHGDHDEFAVAQPGEAGADRQLGEVAHRRAHFGERRRCPSQVARHGAQQHALAQAPQPALQRGFVVVLRARQRRAISAAPKGARAARATSASAASSGRAARRWRAWRERAIFRIGSGIYG